MVAWREIFAMSRAVAGAIAVHVLMLALVIVGTMDWQPFRQPERVAIAIEAVIVDTSEIKRQRDEARRAQELEDRRQQRAAELERQRQREAEQKRQAEEEAARRERELEIQRKREAEDRLKQLRLERERKLEDERLQQQQQRDDRHDPHRMPIVEPAGIRYANDQLREIYRIFGDMGFQIYRTSDVETDAYNFELLNFPPHHPARALGAGRGGAEAGPSAA